jgi:hypothetical protein
MDAGTNVASWRQDAAVFLPLAGYFFQYHRSDAVAAEMRLVLIFLRDN